MTADLTVQTPQIRRAADWLDDASTSLLAGLATGALPRPLTGGSLGTSAEAREVVVAAARRIEHAADATRHLSQLSRVYADKLRTVASTFEATETAVTPG